MSKCQGSMKMVLVLLLLLMALPAAASAEESEVLRALARPSRSTPCLMLTDPGYDLDDETALTVSAALQRRGFLDLRMVVATTYPSLQRARVAKGALRQLGLGHVPVVVGDNGCPEGFDPQPSRLEGSFPARDDELLKEPLAHMRTCLERAEEHSLVLLLIAKATDANALIQAYPELCRQKLKCVVAMGGVEPLGTGLLRASRFATNNRQDQPAADRFYQRVQELGIPLRVVTREAALRTPIPTDFFNQLAATGHTEGVRLLKLEDMYLNGFWRAIRRGDLGPERTVQWFLKGFCKPGAVAPPLGQDIRPILKNRVLYDVIALLASIDDFHTLFDPTVVEVAGTRHEILGLSSEKHGVAQPERLATLITALALEACQVLDHP